MTFNVTLTLTLKLRVYCNSGGRRYRRMINVTIIIIIIIIREVLRELIDVELQWLHVSDPAGDATPPPAYCDAVISVNCFQTTSSSKT